MKNLKILHITDFHLRHSSRLYYSTARKLNNGFIRNNFYVNELSERDFEKKLFFFDKKNYNKKIIEIVENLDWSDLNEPNSHHSAAAKPTSTNSLALPNYLKQNQPRVGPISESIAQAIAPNCL